MTWQLRIGRPLPGESPAETAERLGSPEQEEVAPDPFEIRRMSAVLRDAAPSLTFHEVPKGWSLTHPGSGAQIRMSGDEFGATIPRPFSPAMGRSLWADIWPVIAALANEGYCVYAPPLGRVLDPAGDLDAVVSAHSGAPAVSRAAAPAERKPWWQFWR